MKTFLLLLQSFPLTWFFSTRFSQTFIERFLLLFSAQDSSRPPKYFVVSYLFVFFRHFRVPLNTLKLCLLPTGTNQHCRQDGARRKKVPAERSPITRLLAAEERPATIWRSHRQRTLGAMPRNVVLEREELGTGRNHQKNRSSPGNRLVFDYTATM